jgi:hypothetical protein
VAVTAIAADVSAARRQCTLGFRDRKFIIERDIPKVGTFERENSCAPPRQNRTRSCINSVPTSSGSRVTWQITRLFALAKDEAIIRKHAEISGFPATKVTEVKKMIDPTTAAA